LHGSLLIPEIGRKVVGWMGWAMFVSSATGLWLWWPRNGAVLRALRWRRGASQLFNLHHMLGFWICLPLAVLSLTGVYISFPQTGRALFGVQTEGGRPGGPGAGRNAPTLSDPALSIDQAAAAAAAASPGAKVVAVSLPTRGDKPSWRVQLRRPDAKDVQTVQVGDADGRVKGGGRAERGPQDNISPLMRRVHDGADMGIVWQSIIFVGGVAPAVLGLTGVVMWLRRRARRRALDHHRLAS
jgi:uncharacterized iron-regulated membrane protein